jgi:Sodium/glutamate symporter
VRTIELNLVYTLVLSLLVYFVGQWLVDRVQPLKRFSIPGPVVGGSLVAAALARADAFLGTRVAFTMTLKDTLLQMLFVTVGPAADVRMLVRGGPRVPVFLGVGAAFIIRSERHRPGCRPPPGPPSGRRVAGRLDHPDGRPRDGGGVRWPVRRDDEPPGRDGADHGERHRGPRYRGSRGGPARRVSDPAHRLSASSRPSPP